MHGGGQFRSFVNGFANSTSFDEAAQDFRHAPGLRATAAGREGRFRIEDFADRADARLPQMRPEAFEEAARSFEIVRVHFYPRIDERANEPSPDSALVISSIARAQVAIVVGLVVLFARGQGP